MRILIIICVVIFIASLQIKAQSFSDILNVSYNNFSNSDNEITNSTTKNVQLNLFKTYLVGPPIQLQNLRIIYFSEYKWFQNNFNDGDNENSLLAKNLHDIRLTTILNYKLNKKWALNFTNFSTLKSDFRNFDLSNAYKGTNALTIGFLPRGDDDFRYGIGIAYSKEMGKTRTLPAAFLYYKNDRLLIDLMYPRFNAFYKNNKKFEYGLMVNYDIGAFDVTFNDASIANMATKPTYQAAINLTVTPQISYYVTDNVNLYLKAGVKLLSKQKLLDNDYNEIDNLGFKAKNMESIFGFGLTIKIPNL